MDKYKLLFNVAAKSPCNNRKVGAILLDQYGAILASGYNHTADGSPCEDIAGATEAAVIHAEVACINDWLKKESNMFMPDKMLVTHQPCPACIKAISEAFEDVTVEVIGAFMKFDTGKLRFDLIPSSWSSGDAEVLTFGAKRYKPNNWRNVEDIGRYIAALERHLNDFKKAIEFGDSDKLIDSDSGLHHMKHLRTNAGFLLTLTEDENVYDVNREKGLFHNLENPTNEEGP